jgi:pyruvate dehydrogenase E2 component (dihydrolipoamide acetyltransferase)
MATPTAVDVVMPQMGVSVSEGTITKWLKQEGEEIQADEPLLEISTDKVDTEIPSPGSGVVQQILVQEGETVEVGTRLAVIGAPGEAAAEAPAEPEPAPEQATTQAAAEAAAASSRLRSRCLSQRSRHRRLRPLPHLHRRSPPARTERARASSRQLSRESPPSTTSMSRRCPAPAGAAA